MKRIRNYGCTALYLCFAFILTSSNSVSGTVDGSKLTQKQETEFTQYVRHILGSVELKHKRYFFVRTGMCSACRTKLLSYLSEYHTTKVSTAFACSSERSNLKQLAPRCQITIDIGCEMDMLSFSTPDSFCIVRNRSGGFQIIVINPSTIDDLTKP